MRQTITPALAALTCAAFLFAHTWRSMAFDGLALLLAVGAIYFTAMTTHRHDLERARENNEHTADPETHRQAPVAVGAAGR